MTPLAQRIVREGTVPLAKRTLEDRCGLIAKLPSAHCFEVSQVFEIAQGLAYQINEEWKGPDGRYSNVNLKTAELTFLPAPDTWLEWTADRSDERTGCLLTQEDVRLDEFPTIVDLAMVRWATSHPFMTSLDKFDLKRAEFEKGDDLYTGTLQLRRSFNNNGPVKFTASPGSGRAWNVTLTLNLWALLAIINSPRVIGRRQHMPHAGLQRQIAHSRGMVGKFPLHAWTEIKLEVMPPRIDDGSHEAMLTGQKALHFCRAHLRVRNGRLEHVRSHWRGDPALGMKRSRYVVVPPPLPRR